MLKYGLLFNDIKDIKEICPIVLRINTDYLEINEFINFYLSGIKEKLNIYIKKLYGPTELYECEADTVEKMDFSILTKPLSTCKNKKSIFNKLINLEDSKIISGYLDYNSYFDIYLDYVEDGDRNITLSYLNDLSTGLMNSMGKYLIEKEKYYLNIDSNYMVKLESEFDANVKIYDNKDNLIITLNSKKLAYELKEGKYIIESNKGTMIYFYGKIFEELKQKKIENQGEKFEIKLPLGIEYVLDFGFEGYNTLNFFVDNTYYYEVDQKDYITLHIDNIYKKLKTKLVEGESLYLYYSKDYTKDIEIKYISDSLISPKNDYNFYAITKNEANKNILINNLRYEQIRYQVNYCKNPSEVTLYYQDKLEHESITFNERKTSFDIDELEGGPINLKFELKEDSEFIFSYSFISDEDKKIIKYQKWVDERKELKDLTIQDISLENPSSAYLKFKPNYKNSSTRYIIVAAKKDDNNTEKKFSNPCYVTKLVNEKTEGVKIINVYNVGENDFINANIDLSDLLTDVSEYILTIISQELRFEKKLNYYKPLVFSNAEEVKMEEGKEQVFNLAEYKVKFELIINKKSEQNEMCLLYYELYQTSPFIIEISGPSGDKKGAFSINEKEGFINFLCDESGNYKIFFRKTEIETNNLRATSNNEAKGTFRVFSAESPFDLNINKDNIEFEEFNLERKTAPSLKINVKNLDKDYIKKFSIANVDSSKINEIISIQKNNGENKNLNFQYYTFEKGSNYVININFQKKEGDKYTLEKFNILDFSYDNIQNVVSGNKTFDDIDDKFLIINWKNLNSIIISIIKKDPEFLISELTESQSKKLEKNFQNIHFDILTNLTINKPEKNKFSVLMVKLTEIGTEINFEFVKEKDDDDDDDVGLSAGYIAIISIAGLFVLIIVLFFVIRCLRSRQDIDFNKRAAEITQEKLLNDM